ncbi:hypothetical protein IAU60_001640 [Kwoniella sp. DSM 27419]
MSLGARTHLVLLRPSKDGLASSKVASAMRSVAGNVKAETEWSFALARWLQDSFDWNPQGDIYRQAGIRNFPALEFSSMFDLRYESLGIGVEHPTFEDTMVQQRLKSLLVGSRPGCAYRGMDWLGAYRPAFLTHYVAYHNDEQQVPYRVISLIGDLKVTQIRYEHGKCALVMDEDDMISDLSGPTHITVPRGESSAGFVKKNEIERWRAGIAKAAIYLLTAHEYCGCFLGLFMNGTEFSRLCLIEANHLVLEVGCRSSTSTSQSSPLAEWITDDNNARSLPWDLAGPSNSYPPIDSASEDILVDLIHASARIIESQPLRAPLQPLTPIDLHSGAEATSILQAVKSAPKAEVRTQALTTWDEILSKHQHRQQAKTHLSLTGMGNPLDQQRLIKERISSVQKWVSSTVSESLEMPHLGAEDSSMCSMSPDQEDLQAQLPSSAIEDVEAQWRSPTIEDVQPQSSSSAIEDEELNSSLLRLLGDGVPVDVLLELLREFKTCVTLVDSPTMTRLIEQATWSFARC